MSPEIGSAAEGDTPGDREVAVREQATPENLETNQVSSKPFNPGWRFYTVFTSLCVISFAAALDATSLSVALPVR